MRRRGRAASSRAVSEALSRRQLASTGPFPPRELRHCDARRALYSERNRFGLTNAKYRHTNILMMLKSDPELAPERPFAKARTSENVRALARGRSRAAAI